MPMPPPRALRAPRRSVSVPRASVSLGTAHQRLLAAIDRLIRDENQLYRKTSAYRQLDMSIPTHRALITAVRDDMANVRHLRQLMLRGLGATPLFVDSAKVAKKSAPLSLQRRAPSRSTPSPVRSRALPGAITARERQEAAQQRYKLEQVINNAKYLTALLADIEEIGRDAQPIIPGRSVRETAGSHWTESINFRYEGPARRGMTAPQTRLVAPSREELMRKLIRALPPARNTLLSSLRQMPLSGLGAVTHSDSSPLLWLLLGVTAGYVLFNAATA